MILDLLVAAGGALAAVLGSQRAVLHGAALARGLRMPPCVIGTVFFSFGTDLSEFVNSIVASLSGHGDIAAGDAIGSVFTQGTLCVGLLPFVVRGVIPADRREVLDVCGLTLLGLGLTALLLADGSVSRLDALLLAGAWGAAIAVLWLRRRPGEEPEFEASGAPPGKALALTLVWFVVVAAGAWALVSGLARIAAGLGVPEYVLAFLGASVGTSLPELIIGVSALRRGQTGLAIGDLLGSCLVDATLAVGIGPAFRPTRIDADLALQGIAIAAAGMVAVGAALAVRRKVDRATGVLLLLVYASAYVLLLGGG